MPEPARRYLAPARPDRDLCGRVYEEGGRLYTLVEVRPSADVRRYQRIELSAEQLGLDPITASEPQPDPPASDPDADQDTEDAQEPEPDAPHIQ